MCRADSQSNAVVVHGEARHAELQVGPGAQVEAPKLLTRDRVPRPEVPVPGARSVQQAVRLVADRIAVCAVPSQDLWLVEALVEIPQADPTAAVGRIQAAAASREADLANLVGVTDEDDRLTRQVGGPETYRTIGGAAGDPCARATEASDTDVPAAMRAALRQQLPRSDPPEPRHAVVRPGDEPSAVMAQVQGRDVVDPHREQSQLAAVPCGEKLDPAHPFIGLRRDGHHRSVRAHCERPHARDANGGASLSGFQVAKRDFALGRRRTDVGREHRVPAVGRQRADRGPPGVVATAAEEVHSDPIRVG